MPVVQEWMTAGGAMLSGRRTFDIAGGWADGHPIDLPIFVVTHDPPTEGEWSPQVRFVPEGVERGARARAGGRGRRLRLGRRARRSPQQLLRAGLLDEIQVSVTPVLLGGGVSLFDHFDGPIQLEQIRVVPSDGVTHLRYRVVR